MFDMIFESIFSIGAGGITPLKFILDMVFGVVLGVIFALTHMYRNRFSRSFVLTLALLPTVVAVVIMMVNGNIGAGVAVAGAFSLVRFRSAPGSAREIVAIFMAMAAGLVTGMGYLGYAFLLTVFLGGMNLLFAHLNVGIDKRNSCYRTLRITIPEDLNTMGLFDDILARYTDEWQLVKMKTVNMGSLYRLTYQIKMKKGVNEKEFIDELRVRNGNLEISIFLQEATQGEL